MSQQTREVMEQAIRDHFRDTAEGAYMTDYLLVATGPAATSEERAHAYIYEDGGSPYHVTYGLAMMVQDYVTESKDAEDFDN